MTSELPSKSLQDRARELLDGLPGLRTAIPAASYFPESLFEQHVRPLLVELAELTIWPSPAPRNATTEVVSENMKRIADAFGLELRVVDVICRGRDEQRIQVLANVPYHPDETPPVGSTSAPTMIYIGGSFSVESFLEGFEWRQRVLNHQHKAQGGVIVHIAKP